MKIHHNNRPVSLANTNNLQILVYIRKSTYLTTRTNARGTSQQPTTAAKTRLSILNLPYTSIRTYVPPSPYETELTPEYQRLLEAARISVTQRHPGALAEAMRGSSSAPTYLPENRSELLAQRIAAGVQNIVETAAAMPAMEESKGPLVSVEKPPVILENIKITATARIAKSLDTSENISKQKRVWLICSGVVVIGAVTATAVYCFSRKPRP